MDFTLTFKNNTDNILHYQTFNNDINLIPKINKSEIKPKEYFNFSVNVPSNKALQGVIVFSEFIILIMNNLQKKMGSGIFQIPENKEYQSIVIKEHRNLPNPNSLIFNQVDLEIKIKH
jgi:hypothetical protein